MKKKVVISGSGSLQDKVGYWRSHFESKGYEVSAFPKRWENTESHDSRLNNLYTSFYNAIDECDIFFVMNEDKNGIDGYIGANCTAELIYAVVLKLRSRNDMNIFIANTPGQKNAMFEEVNSFLRLGWIGLYQDQSSKLVH